MSSMWLFCLIPFVEIAIVYALHQKFKSTYAQRAAFALLIIGVVSFASLHGVFYHQDRRARILQERIARQSLKLVQKGHHNLVATAWYQAKLASVPQMLRQVDKNLNLAAEPIQLPPPAPERVPAPGSVLLSLRGSEIFGTLFLTLLLSLPVLLAVAYWHKKSPILTPLVGAAFTILNFSLVIAFTLAFRYSYARTALFQNLNICAEKIAKSAPESAARVITMWQNHPPYSLEYIKKELEEFTPAPHNK